MVEFFVNFAHTSSTISLIVLCWLAFYLFLTFWAFLYRFVGISSMIKKENASLQSLIADESNLPLSISKIEGIVGEGVGKEVLHIWKQKILQDSSKGLTLLGIVASTAPFVGLFGTVVEILEAFSYLGGGEGKVAFDTVAPVISKALIATAAGILTAIPAYSFHLILKRKCYDLSLVLQMQIDYLMSKQTQQLRF